MSKWKIFTLMGERERLWNCPKSKGPGFVEKSTYLLQIIESFKWRHDEGEGKGDE